MRNHEYHNITELTDINDEIVSFINENYSDKVTNTIYKYNIDQEIFVPES